MPSLTKPLIIDVGQITKYFEPSDQVRVTEGKYKGDTGRVIDVDNGKVSVVLDKTQQEIHYKAHCFKLKTDSDMPTDLSMSNSFGNKSNY